MADTTTDATASPAEQHRQLLDPLATDHHGEQQRLREAGPVVRVQLPGGVPAWEVTDYALLAELVTDTRVSKDWRHWTAIQNGQITDDWPLIGMITVTNMVTADGAAHTRLRKPVTSVFTRKRVEALRPRMVEVVDQVLDALPTHADAAGVVDLRTHYAYPIPMTIICDLVGVPPQWRADLRGHVDSIFRTNTSSEEVLATQHDRVALLTELVQLRTQRPAHDITSDLIALRAQDETTLTPDELIDTLWLLVTAGHETTLSLIVNALLALLTHPRQLAIALTGDADIWSRVVEETLRWDAPIGNFPARYPTEDITIAGVTIRQGEAILAAYSGVGRHPRQYTDADRFDITRPPQRHLAFGGGPHLCLGAHLARLEATVALPALFSRYPRLHLAIEPDALAPVPSLFSNSVTALPVLVDGDPDASPLPQR